MDCFMKSNFDIANLHEGSLFGDMIPNFDLHVFSFQQVIQHSFNHQMPKGQKPCSQNAWRWRNLAGLAVHFATIAYHGLYISNPVVKN